MKAEPHEVAAEVEHEKVAAAESLPTGRVERIVSEAKHEDAGRRRIE